MSFQGDQKKLKRLANLTKTAATPARGHDGEGGDDDLVEDVGDHEGGAHDHSVGEGEDEDCGGGRPPEALLETSLLLVQRNAVWNVSSVSWYPSLL